jgi:hypothetical protein
MRAMRLDGSRVRVDGKHADVRQHRDDRNDQQRGSHESMPACSRIHTCGEITGRVNRCQRKQCAVPIYPYHVTYLRPYLHPISGRAVGSGIIGTMDQCCEIKTNLPADQRRVIHVVLWLNSLMFIAEFGAGLAAHSTALLADSVDMLGDAIVYGCSLYAVARGTLWQARVALLKGLIMAALGLGVLIEVSHKLIVGVVPIPGVMNTVGLIALGANTVCLLLLSRHRADDINMRSAWLCSRNDVIANASVLVAAVGVALTGSGWSDIVVGLAIALMFATSAISVIRDARHQMRPAPAR